MLPNGLVIISDIAEVKPTTNIICKCYIASTPQSTIWLPPDIHHPDHKLRGRTKQQAGNYADGTSGNRRVQVPSLLLHCNLCWWPCTSDCFECIWFAQTAPCELEKPEPAEVQDFANQACEEVFAKWATEHDTIRKPSGWWKHFLFVPTCHSIQRIEYPVVATRTLCCLEGSCMFLDTSNLRKWHFCSNSPAF